MACVGARFWSHGRVSWLDRFFRARGDPTRAWVADAGLELVLDLDQHTLAGDALGAQPLALRGLGPAEGSRNAARGILCYPRRGLQLDLDLRPGAGGPRLEGWVLLFGAAEQGGFAFAGPCRQGGRPWDLHAGVSEEDVVARLGPPLEREEDGLQDTVLYYVRRRAVGPDVEWQINFDEGGLCDWVVCPPPTRAAGPSEPGS